MENGVSLKDIDVDSRPALDSGEKMRVGPIIELRNHPEIGISGGNRDLKNIPVNLIDHEIGVGLLPIQTVPDDKFCFFKLQSFFQGACDDDGRRRGKIFR